MEASGVWIAVLLAIGTMVATFLAAFWKTRARVALIVLTALPFVLVIVIAVVITVPWPHLASHPTSSPSPVAVASPSVGPLVETQVNELNVVGDDGQLRKGYTVSERDTGSCDGSSEPLPNDPNAYRCFTTDGTNFVVDPCFALPSGTSVFCPANPWDLTGMLISLSQKVDYTPFTDNASNSDHTLPWALEVVDPHDPSLHWHCLARQGAGDTEAGHAIDWNCTKPDGSGDAAGLDNLIISSDPVWEVLFYNPSNPELVQAKVAAIWN